MIFDTDKYLRPYSDIIVRRQQAILYRKRMIAGYGKKLSDAVNAHLFYGVHVDSERNNVVFREFAPNATAIYLIGDVNGWRKEEDYRFRSVGGGSWELVLPYDKVPHGSLFRWLVEWDGGCGERLPAYATRCVQDPHTKIFSAQVWAPHTPYKWKNKFVPKKEAPLIYEVHIGMSSEQEKVSTFDEFRKDILPKIVSLGYNTIQIMALQEHPYYGSFGYQVSNFFALSSRFGTPEEFKHLVDDAHQAGISVIMDIVHSHAVDNQVEGLGMIDGTDHLYFHSGDRGVHPAWKSRCFDYSKEVTQHFLLSNVKYWMEEYHLDGFRFDGVTSMIYLDHGLGKDFVNYDCYFDGNQDEDAIVYLGLANILVKELNPKAITIAEDVSGLPGLAAILSQGGVGFDYRMSMGVADHWIKWIKEKSDDEWSVGEIFYELTNKRADEKTISYAECHDQALVGDKTLIFRLIDKYMYDSMSVDSHSEVVDRGIALVKMIRLATIATAGNGYLNFMGNEFGHPEWIDFPREGNNWSYFYCRRQWSLADNDSLRYRFLLNFDKEMIHLIKNNKVFNNKPLHIHQDEMQKVLIFERGCLIFAFNFHPTQSVTDFRFSASSGEYRLVFDTDSADFNGFGRNDSGITHCTIKEYNDSKLSLYLPCRSAIVLRKIK